MGPELRNFMDDYEPGIESQIQRWQNPSSTGEWENNVNEMFSFLLERPVIFDQQLNDFFGWDGANPQDDSFDPKLLWNIYPNPVHTILNVESELFFQTKWSVQILSSQGEILFEKESLENSNMQFQMEKMPAGAYIVRIYSNVYQANYQVIKLKTEN